KKKQSAVYLGDSALFTIIPSCVHRLRGSQGVSEASGLKHTPFLCPYREKTPLMILARLHGYARTYLAGILAAKIR
ncbi:TPA: hypothetical protein ACXF8K_005260, partial [Klebsiella pneumoniae]